MRKLISLLIILLFTLTILACEPNKYFFKNNTRTDEIISVELISYYSDDVAVTESADQMLDFLTDNLEVLEPLDQTKIIDFYTEFSNIEFFQGYPHLNTPNGMGVRIAFENGDFLIVTDSLVDEDRYGGDAILYDSSGVFIEYYGGLSWRQNFIDLVNAYFEVQIG